MTIMQQNDSTKRNRLIIRTSRHSLTFATQCIDEPETSVVMHPFITKGTMSIAANLREAFRTMEIFSATYHKVAVVADTPKVIIPVDLFKENDAPELFSHSYSTIDNMVVKSNIVPDLNVATVFGLTKDLHTVINDRYPEATLFCASTPVWRYLFKRSFLGTKGKVYAYFHDQLLEVLNYGQNRFRYNNTFDISNAHDALYFILNVWKQLSMNQQQDELHLVGDIPEQEWLENELKGYIAKVYTIKPSSDFNRSPIAQIKSMPYDMMTYLIKGR